MGSAPWPAAFEGALRRHMFLLADDRSIPESVNLVDLGIDSISTIALLIELEEGFGVQFPDELLTAETFATPATLWRAVCDLQASGSPPPDRAQASSGSGSAPAQVGEATVPISSSTGPEDLDAAGQGF